MKKRFESNGDTIRNMSNEELSEMLATMDMSPDGSDRIVDQEEWLDWLYSDSKLKWKGNAIRYIPVKHYAIWLCVSITSAMLGIASIIISLTK